MAFTYDDFVRDARTAARDPEPTKAVRRLLEATLEDPSAIAEAIPDQADDEIMLFEDETVSIWSCRFQPHVVMPPHEHKMTAHIGVFRGGEKNILFRREPDALRHVKTTVVQPGDVFSIGPDGIHAVTAEGDLASHALHVYLGPLMQVERALFDWHTGAAVAFTMENFHRMKRPASELADY